MLVFPAVDIQDGQCVRLRQGDPGRKTVYESDPLKAAARWRDAGAQWLHVVNLNAALDGPDRNRTVVERIIRETGLRVEVGGGIRTADDASRWLDAGAELVVIGTLAAEDPSGAAALCRARPGRIVIAVDARAGMVVTHGWRQVTDQSVLDLAHRFEDASPAAYLYTDIEKDGMLTHPNFKATRALIEATSVPVIASGGVSRIEDVAELGRLGAAAVIIGKALYDGALSFADAAREAGAAAPAHALRPPGEGARP